MSLHNNQLEFLIDTIPVERLNIAIMTLQQLRVGSKVCFLCIITTSMQRYYRDKHSENRTGDIQSPAS